MTFLRVSCLLLGLERADTFPGAFYMVGDIESARAKGEKILAELDSN